MGDAPGQVSLRSALKELREYCADAGEHEASQVVTRAEARIEVLENALRNLSFAAQTSGGTAGRDDVLVAAINLAAAALNDLRGAA